MVKRRQPGQGTQEELAGRDLRAELEEREEVHFLKRRRELEGQTGNAAIEAAPAAKWQRTVPASEPTSEAGPDVDLDSDDPETEDSGDRYVTFRLSRVLGSNVLVSRQQQSPTHSSPPLPQR